MVEAHTGSADSSHIRFQNIFEQIDLNHRKTKIACTLGPSCWDTDMLVKMLDAGMNVARLNFSHGDHVVSDSVDSERHADRFCDWLTDPRQISRQPARGSEAASRQDVRYHARHEGP